jgi:hypothetical protein
MHSPSDTPATCITITLLLFHGAVPLLCCCAPQDPRSWECCGAAAGLSLGEYCALVWAGALEFEEALKVGDGAVAAGARGVIELRNVSSVTRGLYSYRLRTFSPGPVYILMVRCIRA